jgi:legumain
MRSRICAVLCLEKKMTLLLLFCVFGSIAKSEEWFLSVAGSKDWNNYRHQADNCHAYQIAREHGIPDERIIVMYYDDIANNPDNPFPGQIFNAPTDDNIPGRDVYQNCKKDYTGDNVTAEQFLAVLTANISIAKGKVLESGPEDHVFVSFFDHGAQGFLCFPTGPYLRTHELMAAFQIMKHKKMFKQLTMYVEACESGSLFEMLPEEDHIYVTTASNANESSWATFCPPGGDFVKGTPLNTCLGDVFAVQWLEDDDHQSTLSETLEQQFLRVRKQTRTSHVMQYGDKHFVEEPLSTFLGSGVTQTKVAKVGTKAPETTDIPSWDVPMHLAYYRYLRSNKLGDGQKLQEILNRRLEITHFMTKQPNMTIDEFQQKFGLDDFSLQFIHFLQS